MDEIFTEKTMAADPLEEQTPKEAPAEAANPYEARPNPAAFEQPKPQYQPPQPQYMPPQYQPPQYQQPQYQQPPQYRPPQQQYMQQPPQYQPPQYRPQPSEYYRPVQPQYHQVYRQPVPGGGAAKAFAIVAFVAGCISISILLVLLMSTGTISFNLKYRSGRGALAALALTYGFIFSVPGLVFGIVAMAKKTNKFPLAILGTIFCASLLLYGIIMLMSIA